MSRLQFQRADLVNINNDIRSYRNEIAALLRLYSIKPKDIGEIEDKNHNRWSEFKGEVNTLDPLPIPENLLRKTYDIILTRIDDMRLSRRSLNNLPDGTSKQGGLAKLKELAVKTASGLTMHDKPVIHLGRDLYNLSFSDDGKVQPYSNYSIKVGPSWVRKVHRRDLAIQDIAGREAMVLDAEKLPTTPEGYEAYATKIVTIRRPISRKGQLELAGKWEEKHIKGAGTLARYYDFKHPAFLRYETRYVVRTMTTDGWKSCTGTTVNWAASTLKRRMKTIMLRKLSV